MTLQEIFDLGGFGAYVWPSYGLAVVILGGLTTNALARYFAAKRRLDALESEHDMDRS